MSYQLPDDVLCLIQKYAKPYWTRNDWRLCGYRESSLISRYYKWQDLLYHEVQWNPLRSAWDGEKIMRYVQSTKMVQSLLRFEKENESTCMLEILRRWLQEECLFSDLILLPS